MCLHVHNLVLQSDCRIESHDHKQMLNFEELHDSEMEHAIDIASIKARICLIMVL